MGYTNIEVAEHLQNIATAYEIKHKDKFRITAYQNAADTILGYPENIYSLWQQNPQNLDHVPNIGPGIIKKLDYFFNHSQPYPKLKPIFDNIHPAVFVFTKINGIGPLIAHKLTQNLQFSVNSNTALNQLIRHAQLHHIQHIPSLGERSEKLILDNTLAFLGRQKRMSLSTAKKLAIKIIRFLNSQFPEIKFVPLGSLRRQSDTVGDIDIAAASNSSNQIISHFINYPDALSVISRGHQKASIRLLHDIHVDLMVKSPSTFGSLLQHFTGSRQHNILLRKHALKMGYSLSEYGIKDIKTKKIHRFDTEEKFYRFLGLKLIPPSLRLGKNELAKYQL